MSLSKVIEVAREELGNTEWPPGSNMQKYGEAYGWNGVPYCAQFLWWTFNRAGEKEAFIGGGKTASCGELYRYYKERGQTVKPSKAQVGDIAILNFSGTKETQHCGLLVEKVGNQGWWRTIEGNTSPGDEGSQDNGGCVALKLRHINQMVGICRPQFKEEPVIDYKGHWAEKEIDWAKSIGIIKGYADGSFQPDRNITRAEIVTILRRYDEYRFGGEEKK